MTNKTMVAEFINATEAAVYIGLSPNTLARWRCEKINLNYYKIGGAIRYKKEELDAYAEKNKVSIKADI